MGTTARAPELRQCGRFSGAEFSGEQLIETLNFFCCIGARGGVALVQTRRTRFTKRFDGH